MFREKVQQWDVKSEKGKLRVVLVEVGVRCWTTTVRSPEVCSFLFVMLSRTRRPRLLRPRRRAAWTTARRKSPPPLVVNSATVTITFVRKAARCSEDARSSSRLPPPSHGRRSLSRSLVSVFTLMLDRPGVAVLTHLPRRLQ